jgi:hypothetical protein
MGKLYCDIKGCKPVVDVDPDSFANVQEAMQKHLAGAPVNRIYGMLIQAGPSWHITPSADGKDWHIGPA